MIIIFSIIGTATAAMLLTIWYIGYGANWLHYKKLKPLLFKKLASMDLNLATFEPVISPIDQWEIYVGDRTFTGFDDKLCFGGTIWELHELPKNWQEFLKQYLK